MRKRHLEERRKLLEQTEEFGMSEMENELQRLEDDLDANEEDELFCMACNKELRNEKAFAAHRKQKKHLENVKKLKEVMMEEDLLNSDDFKDSDYSEQRFVKNIASFRDGVNYEFDKIKGFCNLIYSRNFGNTVMGTSVLSRPFYVLKSLTIQCHFTT